MERKIIHIDMDAFFASVEQRDNPELRGRPVIVGGDPAGRGVVAACSYEARKFGIHSAMSCARARRLCPGALFIRPRKDRYREVSAEIMEIFHRYARQVEPLSLDEAFLDVTDNLRGIPSATWTAEAIRRDIFSATGLTASAGVSCNKFLAKVASDMNKPDGITVIPPEQAVACIRGLPVRRFFGVGRVTEQRMHRLGIRTGADLAGYSREELLELFGKSGAFFYDIVRGIDQRPVRPRQGRKSVGSEVTLREDLAEPARMLAVLEQVAGEVQQALAKKDLAGRTLVLKVRYQDFVTVTRSRTSCALFATAAEMMEQVPSLLASTEAGERRVRLLGLTVTNFPGSTGRSPCRQLLLPFPPPGRRP